MKKKRLQLHYANLIDYISLLCIFRTEVSSLHSDSDDSDMVVVGMDDGIDVASLGGASDAFGSADPLDELAASHPVPVEEGAEAVDGDDAAGGKDEDDDSVSTSFSAASTRNKEKVSIVTLKVKACFVARSVSEMVVYIGLSVSYSCRVPF